jgi:hypothetical protein
MMEEAEKEQVVELVKVATPNSRTCRPRPRIILGLDQGTGGLAAASSEGRRQIIPVVRLPSSVFWRLSSVAAFAVLIALMCYRAACAQSPPMLMEEIQGSSSEIATTPRQPAMSTLSVAPGGRYLQNADGAPFLIIGDNAQALFQNLPLTGSSSGNANANATYYLSTRQGQGINVIWATLVCSNVAGCRTNTSQTYDSLTPFSSTISACGTTTPNCWDMSTAGNSANASYWSRMDAMINLAAQYEIVVFLTPVEPGDCNLQNDNPLWPMLTENHSVSTGGHTNTYLFGQFLGNRYKSFPNIVWQFGDDYQCNGQGGGTPAADDAPIVDIMNGIAAAEDTHPQTLELEYAKSTTFDNPDFLPPIGNANVNSVYMYYPLYAETLHAYNQSTAPAYVVETNYEWDNNLGYEPNDPSCAYPGRRSSCTYEYTIRKQFYWAMLAGSNAGYITGEFPISSAGFCSYPYVGSSCTAGSGWVNYMSSTGMTNFGYWRSLFLNNSIPWWALVPDQSSTFVTAGRGYYNNASCTTNSHGHCMTSDNYVTAASANTANGKYLVAYVSCYRTNSNYRCTGTGGLTVAMSQLGINPTARWYDPTNGTFTTICSPSTTACSSSSQTFTPSNANNAGDPDWVLVIH